MDNIIMQARRIKESNPELTFEECKQIASELIIEWSNEDTLEEINES